MLHILDIIIFLHVGFDWRCGRHVLVSRSHTEDQDRGTFFSRNLTVNGRRRAIFMSSTCGCADLGGEIAKLCLSFENLFNIVFVCSFFRHKFGH